MRHEKCIAGMRDMIQQAIREQYLGLEHHLVISSVTIVKVFWVI